LEYNAIHEKQAEAEGLPVELVFARRHLRLVFVSRPFLQFVVFLEALIGSNCSSTNLAAYGKCLFEQLEDMACANETLYKLFLEAIHPGWLSNEMAHTAGGKPPDFSKDLRPLFELLIHKYRKVRQADFLKAHQCWVCEESEALRRRLKNIQGKNKKQRGENQTKAASLRAEEGDSPAGDGKGPADSFSAEADDAFAFADKQHRR